MKSYGQETQLPKLEFVRELEQFDGPILTELRGVPRGTYVEKWCARGDALHRFLVVRADSRAIAEYLAERLTMMELLTVGSDGIGFLVDRGRDGGPVRVTIAPLTCLPEPYLPKDTALHDRSLRPSWDLTPQSFTMGNDWSAHAFADLERWYMNAYSLAFFMSANSEQMLPPQTIFRYDLKGYSYARALAEMRTHVPKAHKARATAVAAASPGVLTIDAPTKWADSVLDAVQAVGESEVAYRAVHRWSKLETENLDRLPETDQVLEELVRLCDSMRIKIGRLFAAFAGTEPSLQKIGEAAPSELLVAGKLAAAYYRAMLRLLMLPADAEFLSVGRPREEDERLRNIQDEADDDP